MAGNQFLFEVNGESFVIPNASDAFSQSHTSVTTEAPIRQTKHIEEPTREADLTDPTGIAIAAGLGILVTLSVITNS